MIVERDSVALGFEQLPRQLIIDSEKQCRQPQREYISFNIGRWINTQAQEFSDLRTYSHRLGAANYEEAPAEEVELQHDEYRPTKIIVPEDVHIMSIYASDARQLLMQAFGGADGRLRYPKKVKQKVRNMSGRYKKEFERRNRAIQDAITYDLQAPEANPRHLPIDPRDIGHTALRFTSGIFDTTQKLKGFGDGRKFGITFSPEAERFLNEERAVSLDFIMNRLGIKYIDTRLEDRILGRQHHATLIKKGGSDPYSLSYPTDEIGDILPVPSTLVTEFDPKMRYIDGTTQRAT